jgi:hypothetical protein
VTHTREGWFAVGLLVMFNGIVFSGVQFGIAVMRMAEDAPEDDDDRGGSPAVDRALVPIPIEDRRGRI